MSLESTVPLFSICKDKIMLCRYFCGGTGSEKLRSLLSAMITEASKTHLDSALSKPTSTCCSSAVIQSFLTSYQYRMCPNTGSPSISHLYLCAVVAVLEEHLYHKQRVTRGGSLSFIIFFPA